jgi:hypothetical protein
MCSKDEAALEIDYEEVSVEYSDVEEGEEGGEGAQQKTNEFLENLKKYNFYDSNYNEHIKQNYLNDENDIKSNQPTEPETDPQNQNNLIEPSNQGVQNSNLNKNKKETKRKLGDDNIRSKIKNNFLLFVFTFLNNLIYQQYGYQKILFRKLKYKDIRSKEYNKEFLQKKFYEIILDNNITSKYKKKDLELNKKHLKKIDLNDNSNISNFLNMTMKFIYNNYFLNKKHEKNYFLNQKHEIVYFDDFIEKLKDKNENEYYIEKFKKIGKEDYISYYFKEKKQIKKKIKFICKK